MFGLDFTINTPQDVFIYIKGNWGILHSGSFQQTTRTRNINNINNEMTEALIKNCFIE